MPDISQELEIIAHEPKGRLVKDAIHDALDKINQTANRRPTAKIGIPINEVIIDTGWISEWAIGALIEGDLHRFDGIVDNQAYSVSGSENVLRMFANHTGKAFIVATSAWDSDNQIVPTISDTSGLEWHMERTFKISVMAYDKDNSELPQYVSDPTIRGYVYSADELPEADATTVGDVYVDNTNDITYYGKEENGVYSWGVITDPTPAGLCLKTRSDRVTVWSATLQEPIQIVANITDSGLYLASGLFVVYDTIDTAFSEYDCRVAVPNARGRGYWVYTYAQKVETYDDLPENGPDTPSPKSLYYVSDNDTCYEYQDDGWVSLAWNVFDASVDSRTIVGPTEGIQVGTAKIYVISGYYENDSYINPLELIDTGSMSEHMEPVVSAKAGGSKISAWFQEDGLSGYPWFKPSCGTEEYLNLRDRSLAIFEIELIPHQEGSE